MQQGIWRSSPFGSVQDRACLSVRRFAHLVAAGGLVLAGCTATPSAPTAAPTTSAAGAAAPAAKPAPTTAGQANGGAPATLTFGGINALTGQSAAPGIRVQHGAE